MYKVEVTRLVSGEQAFFDLSQDELNALFPEIFKGGVLKKFSLTFSEYPLPNWKENPNWLEEEIEAGRAVRLDHPARELAQGILLPGTRWKLKKR